VVMSARPGRISADMAVDAPFPRDEEFRLSPAYNEYCRRASEALRHAMAQSPDDPE
jgi:NitT/TauT family transport system ATP-binding protein